ncbi:hypothetical protein ACFL1X_06610 [Candidatus Hydrogenedentota bacterium]
MDLRILENTPPWDWPKDTDVFLLEILRDCRVDVADRLLAVGFAGDCVVINDELVDALLSILQSNGEPELLRGMAAIALGPVLDTGDIELMGMDEFDEPDDVPISLQTFKMIQATFHKLYTEAAVPEEVRRRILEASVRAPQDWHKGAIRAAYASDDEDWKLTAVFGMNYIRGFDEQIRESLDSDNSDIRYEAERAAGAGEDDEDSDFAF